jgi:hypothetical protein
MVVLIAVSFVFGRQGSHEGGDVIDGAQCYYD